MLYLVLFVLSVLGWFMDLILQAVYFWGTGPFGMPNVTADVTVSFFKSAYYSAYFFALFSLPAMVALFIHQIIRRNNPPASMVPTGIYILHIILLTFLICINHADHEIFRFMGMHYSIEMLRAYNIFSSTTSFVGDALRTDARGPYSSVILFVIPAFFCILSIAFRKKICGIGQKLNAKMSNLLASIIAWAGVAILIVLMLNSFVKVDNMRGFGWYPSRVQQKLAPYFIALIEDIRLSKDHQNGIIDYASISKDIENFQQRWTAEEMDKNWQFISSDLPFQKTYKGNCPPALGQNKPNIVIIFVETMRAMNLPDFNKEVKEDPMPFLHSLITGQNEIMQKHKMHSAWFDRYLAAALPTIDAMMSTHIGMPAHSEYTVSSVFFSSRFPSFVSYLRQHGYYSAFLDSADAGFTNWSNWVRRWYEDFYDLMTRDDKVATKALGDLIIERRKQNNPYIMTMITTTNHIPFDVPEGGVQPPKDAKATERIKYTLRYTDDQLKELFDRLDKNDALSNTLFLILGDHGYSLDEVPNESGIGGNYDTLRYNVVWVPLIMLTDLEGLPQGHQSVPASHIDLGPTLLAAAGICDDNSFIGHSLLHPGNHQILVNKKSNYLYRDNQYTLIGVQGYREQLYRTDDFLEKHDFWQEDTKALERLKTNAISYRRLIDYVYENHKTPALEQ